MADLMARIRLGRDRGVAALSKAGAFEPVHRGLIESVAIGPEDNVVLLGGHDLRPAMLIAPRCRLLTVLEDMPDAALIEREADLRGKGLRNVNFKWWRSGTIPTPQGTADCIISLNFIFRTKDPATAFRDLVFTSHHGCRLAICEPSSSLDGRTVRKYSREADLSMGDHRALVVWSKSAAAHRSFSREGLSSLMQQSGMKQVHVKDVLHGLALMATAVVEF